MKTFFKKLWKVLITPLPELPEENYNDQFYRASKPKNNDSWCPYCGYSGSSDDLRCHFLNDHNK